MSMLGALAGLGKGLSMLGEDNLKAIQRSEESAIAEDRQKRIAEWQAKMHQEYKIDDEERATERKRNEEKQLSDADDAARARSKEIGTDRRLDDFKSKLGQTDATPEELKEAFKSYDNKAIQAGDKVDTQFVDKRRADAAGDYVKAAREGGNTGLLSQAKQERDAAIRQDSEDMKDQRGREETARKESRDDARHEEAMARVDRASGKVDPTHRLALTTQLNAANKDVTELRKSLAAFDADLANKISADPDVAKQRAQIASDLEEAKATKRDLLGQFKTLGIPHPEADGSDKPSGMLSQSGSGKRYAGVNEDGSVKYEPAGAGAKLSSGSPQANEKDRVAIIMAEYEKALASGNETDAMALIAELKRLGVSVSAKPSESKPNGGQSSRLSQFKVIR